MDIISYFFQNTIFLSGNTKIEVKKLKDKNTEIKQIIDDYDYLTSAASATEFTGLIPFLPQSDAELESYNDICPYLPRAASSKKKPQDPTD